MFLTLWRNLKGWPTTIVGVSSIVATLATSPSIQQIASLNPQAGSVIGTVGAIAAGLTLIFGAGAKPQ
jgi:hypothetical protein